MMTDTSSPRKRKAGEPSSPKRKKAIACLPCHTRKVKCSGGTPCSNCTRSRVPEACSYPVRDQRLTLTASELDHLVATRILEQQREVGDRVSQPSVSAETTDDPSTVASSSLSTGPARNPLLNDGSWFEPFQETQIPIHIGEASDSAFATRFRQEISASAQHFPRKQYVSDSKILSLSNMECVWPPVSRARFLVKVALRINCSIYHCIRKSEILDGLEQYYRTQPVSGKYFSCKLLALFAIGEVYSTRTQSLSENTFPGINYFSRASRILRECNERPQIEMIECTLLLAIYSLLLNRRHSAYQLASSAVRQAIIVGLQQNMPEPLSPDKTLREHCVRVWWTAYTLDRLTSSQLGYPASIQDDDISVDLPSNELEDEDFADAAFLLANVRLARVSRKIIFSLYSRNSMNIPFAKRVQNTLKELQYWVEELPTQLRMETKPLTLPVTWLHLSFNQHVILATRPILLHILRSPRLSTANVKDTAEDLLQALAEACLHAARHSHRMLTDAWVDGSFATFDYTYTHCLFSVAIVLAISSLTTNNNDDYDNFIIACGWIQQLSQSGNFAAMGFLQHLSELQNAIAPPTNQRSSNVDLRSGTLTGSVSSSGVDEYSTWLSDSQLMTTEMALGEPFLQEFLSQTDLDMCFNAQLYNTELQSLYV